MSVELDDSPDGQFWIVRSIHGANRVREVVLTDEELRSLIEQAKRAGVLDQMGFIDPLGE